VEIVLEIQQQQNNNNNNNNMHITFVQVTT